MKEWLPILLFSPVREQHQNPFVYERFFVLTFFFLLPTQFSAVYCMHARMCACVYGHVDVCKFWCRDVCMFRFLLRQYMCVWYVSSGASDGGM